MCGNALCRIDELRDESQEKSRGLWVQCFHQYTLAESTPGARYWHVAWQCDTRFPNGLQPQPEEIAGTDDLERREGFGACQD